MLIRFPHVKLHHCKVDTDSNKHSCHFKSAYRFIILLTTPFNTDEVQLVVSAMEPSLQMNSDSASKAVSASLHVWWC